MNAIIYITIFIIGTLFGSFYTLAVYRIPKKIDIVKTHSFCPNCNHKLGFFELIPVLSYIFLGGKCKKCKQKIRPRYLILEVLSGLALELIALGIKINIYTLNIKILIEFVFIVLYLVAIFLIAGIDKEYRKIEKGVIYYALVVAVAYILYLCIIDNTSIYRYAMYLITLLVLLIVDTINLRKTAKDNYTLSILMLITIMVAFTGTGIVIITLIATLLCILLTIVIFKIKNKLNKVIKQQVNITEKLPIGYCMSLLNVVILIMMLFVVS